MPEPSKNDPIGLKTGEGTIRHYWATAGLAVVLAALLTSAIGAGVAIYTHSGSSLEVGGVSIQKQRPSGVPPSATPASPSVAPSVALTSELYSANWSTGLNGWTGGSEWKPVSGLLVSDGTGNGDDTILAPLLPRLPNYAIEAQIRLVRKPVALATCYFGVVGHVKNNGGYYVGPRNGGGSYVLVIAQQSSGFPQLSSQPDDPGTDPHTYRVEFRGNQIIVMIDGYSVLQTSDNQYLDPGKVGLYNYGCPIEVSGFTVKSLPA